MNNLYDTRLQVPIATTLLKKAQKRAESLGYSSLQEIVRVFLKGLVDKKYEPSFVEREELSPRAAARYEKMINDILSGKEKAYGPFDNVDDLMRSLNE